jgi:lipopolysaccharide heptosyltransferase II
MTQSLKKYRNILLIKPGAIGDLIHMTPVIRALHDAYPEASISIMVSSRLSASLFTFHPLIKKTIVYDRKGSHRSFVSFVKLWNELRRDGYDLVVNFQRSNLKGWLLSFASFPARFLTYHKAKNRVVHVVLDHLETLAPLGIDPLAADTRLELHTGPDDERYADEIFADPPLAGRRVVAFNPGTNSPVRCWPPERFSELGNLLTAEPGVEVVILGGPNELELAARVAGGMVRPPLVLAGCTLLQLGAVLKRCALLVTGDTGPMHLAAAVGARIVALYGSMDPGRSRPEGVELRIIQHREVPCVPCRSHNHCSSEHYLECMEKITADEVFSAVTAMITPKE